MRQGEPTPAVMPLRAVLVALLLAGFGLWQGWQCTDGMMTSPITFTTINASMPHTGHMASPVAATHDTGHDPGMPTGMSGLCISVLAGLAGAFTLLRSPLGVLALLRRAAAVLLPPVGPASTGPSLSQLCVSRT